MDASSSKLGTLHNLLDYESCKLYRAEMQLQQRLREWINEVSAPAFKTVLNKYLEFVQEHIKKLQGFFDEEKESLLCVASHVMQAYIQEADEQMSHCSDMKVKEASLLASIQAINHFKISSYGTLSAFANALGINKTAGIFHAVEMNEKEIDQRLSGIAEHEINIKAKTPIALPETVYGFSKSSSL